MNTPISIKLTGKEGLDPHFSARLAMEAMKFKADITLSHQGRVVNAKMLTDVMSIGAEHGSLIQIHAEGEDAGPALDALIALIQNS
jgi:phosphocarrier protein